MSTENVEPLIEFSQVRKAGGSKSIFDDLTLSVRRGETMTILGGTPGVAIVAEQVRALPPVEFNTYSPCTG